VKEINTRSAHPQYVFIILCTCLDGFHPHIENEKRSFHSQNSVMNH